MFEYIVYKSVEYGKYPNERLKLERVGKIKAKNKEIALRDAKSKFKDKNIDVIRI